MLFRKNLGSFYALMLLVLASYGDAMAAGKSVDSPWDDFYMGIGVGQSAFEQAAACDRIGRKCNLTETSKKLFAGYEFNSFFSTEFGYMSYGNFELSKTDANKGMIEVDVLFVNSFLSYPVFKWGSVFGKLGYSRWSSDSALLDEEGSSDNNGYDVSYGLGMSFSFSKDIGVRTEWERFYLDDGESDSLIGSIFFSF